jgi:N-acetylmuramoyl-L-alanine amidase
VIDRSTMRLGAAALALFLTACAAPAAAPPPTGPVVEPPPAAGIPAIPLVDGPLAIRVVHPTAAVELPRADSLFIYGSTGSGRATLTINGADVRVEPNGAFIAFLPRPSDGTFRLVARRGSETAEASVSYRPPPPPGPPGTLTTVDYPSPRAVLVTAGADTLATGSDVAIGRPTPTGAYQWFIPRGARLMLTGERGDMVRVRLGGTDAWFTRTDVAPAPSSAAATVTLGAIEIRPDTDWTDVRLPVGSAPFRVVASDSLVQVTLHGVAATATRQTSQDGVVALVEAASGGPDGTTVRIWPRRTVWGYKAFYEADGTLVLRLRRPPTIDPAAPLRGIRVLVDPGHPPGGATGPTGLTEADANLGISLRLAEQLRRRGADVHLTRASGAELSLQARVVQAVTIDADVLISVHNNAFPEGVNPFFRNGTSTYYFHPFSSDFARIMNQEIVSATRIRDLGPIQGNLALVRPTWMPSILTESLFMPIPDQEAALRNSLFLEQLAAAHVRGLERFILARLGGGDPGGRATGR